MADQDFPDHPLEPGSPAREQRIRERAYHLWEADGRPDGRAEEYWERAEALLGLDGDPTAGQLANPIAAGADPSAMTVEEASIQDNLGEFPDRFADQGEWRQTPLPHPPPAEPASVAAAAKPGGRKGAGKAAKGRSGAKA
jgi:hypothetical protein